MPDLKIDPDSPRPVYVQVANHVQGLVETGNLRPGARLPSERDLAAEYGVALGTIRRATRELSERGLVVSVQGKGTYVIER
ncbi:MAG: GntR family transcriptional regulator [Carbonactinosporaceae bacterium]